MTLDNLKRKYYRSESEALANSLNANASGSVIAIKGVKGSALAFIAAQTAENCDTTVRYRHTFFEALKRFLKAAFTLIRRQIEKKRSIA